MRSLIVLLAGLVAGGCASLPSGKPDPRDPWERFNRASFKFNDALDRAVLRPTARGYVKVVPRFVRTGVSNFFANLETVNTLINDTLQGKFRDAGQDTARLLMNSTLGLGGLFDPATAAGIDKNDEDFGQTLGAWGVESGPYLMIPFLGPSTMRDAAGRVPDHFADPAHYLEDDSTRYTITAIEIIDLRASLLDLDDDLAQSFDRYAFVRNAWLQRREYKVKDGNVEDPVFDEEELLNEEPAAPASSPDSEAAPEAAQ